MQTLLFIPDICGFTSFVKEVEIKHSKHIVSELLELLLERTIGSFELAEVEGDALFLYTGMESLEKKQVFNLIEQMHQAFHSHLEIYKYKRICNCGACSSASKLGLKFILHAGDIEITEVAGKKKPFGPAVIEAHRLLKVDSPLSEYVLLSDQLKDDFALPAQELFGQLTNGKAIFDEKELLYSLAELKPNNEVRTIERPFPQLENLRKVEQSMTLSTDVDTTFQYIVDFDKRLEWSQGIDDLKFDEKQINQIDSSHTCVVNGVDVEIQSIFVEHEKDKKIYIEETRSIPNIETLTTVFQLEKAKDGSKLNVQAFIKPKNLLGRITQFIIQRNLSKGLAISLSKIKTNLES